MVVPAGGISNVDVRLVDTDGQWDTVTGLLKLWGLRRSDDHGASWYWWIYEPGVDSNGVAMPPDTLLADPLEGIPFGRRTRQGGMPFLIVDGSAIQTAAGARVCLGIYTNTAILLGATIAIGKD